MYTPDASRRFEAVEVRTPEGSFHFFRGDGHTADDIAASTTRRIWNARKMRVAPADVAVLNQRGDCLRHDPAKFRSATVIYVSLAGA